MQQKNGKWTDRLLIAALAVLLALAYSLFVFPNSFAPTGINGIMTMIQYLFHIDLGYLSLLGNLPLLIVFWKRVGSEFSGKTLVFVVTFSVANLLMRHFGVERFGYHTENGTSLILGPIVAGLVSGFAYGVTLSHGGSTGGLDVLAAAVRKRHPEMDLVWVIFCLNASVAVISFFVYGYKFEPVIMCLIYCYVSSQVSGHMLRGLKKALKFEVVTEEIEALSQALIAQMHHGVTVVPAEGMYSHQEKKLLICLVNPRQIVQFQDLLRQFPGSFAYVSEVTETMGNFKHIAPENLQKSANRC